MKKVLITGGTGFVGRHVCEKLHRLGWHITVPTRRMSKAAAVQHLPRVTVLQADVHRTEDLLRLLPGHDAVVHLVAILHGTEAAFEQTHVTLPRQLAAAMNASGVRRLVHVSALGVSETGPSRYQRSKARGEAVLHEAGLDLTVLRPSVIYGQGDRFLNLFAQMQSVLPFVPLASAGARFQPVWVEDVAEAVAASLDPARYGRDSIGQTYDAAGPDVLTLAQLVQLAGRIGSRQRPVIPLPAFVGNIQARLMELAPGEPLMSRDNLAAMTVDNVADGSLPGLQALGITPAAIEAVAPSYLGHRGGRDALLAYRRQPPR